MVSFASISTALPPASVAGARPAARRASCVVHASVAAPAAAARRTHYEVLGVGAGASRGEIKAAYRRLAREVHPDAGGGGGEGAEFIRLHAAYSTLADPDSRASYDRAMAGPALRRRTAAAPGFRRRTWETDQCW